MKYCLSGRQPISILNKCDEIKIDFSDRDRILDYVDILSSKTIILAVPQQAWTLNWQLLTAYADKVNFMLCLETLELAEECTKHNIQFYWEKPITTYYDLRRVVALNPCYIVLGAPLSFDLPKVKAITQIPIRLCPNVAHDNTIPCPDGVCGQWVRPEDTAVYEQYVDTYEFITDELKREQVLFHVYKDNGNWPGNTNLLIDNLKYNVDNRAIPIEWGETRTKCGQRCMSHGTCHYCYTMLQFAENVRKKHEDMAFTKEN